VSERERREQEEEQSVQAEELGAGEELPLFLPTPRSWHPRTRSRGWAHLSLVPLLSLSVSISFGVSFVISLVRIDSFLRQAWAGGRGVHYAATARTADGKPGQKVRRHRLDRLNASTIKAPLVRPYLEKLLLKSGEPSIWG